MNVLIVDDQIHVVNGIVNGVDWKALGISQTFTAYNAFEARQLFSTQKIDIMVCDIEMPVESGISLFRWVKSQNYPVECIFLTAHADFSYAQEAIRLGSFDYILQPARYEDIQSAILRAKNRILSKQETSLYSLYGQTFSQNRAALLDGIVQRCLTGQKTSLATACQGMEHLGISMVSGQPVLSVLLHRLSWTEGSKAWETGLLRYAMENILSEILGAHHYKTLLAQLEEDFILIIYQRDGMAPVQEEITGQMKIFLEICRKEIGVSLACYLSDPQPETNLQAQVAALHKQKLDNVSKAPGVFLTENGGKDGGNLHFESQMKCWEQMLASENALPVKEEIHTWLDHKAEEGVLSANSLKLFYQSLIQMLSVTAEQKGIQLQEYLHEPELLDLYLTAYRSVEDMKRLVDYVIPCFQGEQSEDSKTQIDRVLQYIYNHIESDLKRTDIAREVFLNPDYVSRMFKKEMGVSLKEFIINEKMKLAKSLLKSTKLPISTIALRVGYRNFSHFSQSYKRVMGLTPEEDRRD